jgi:hypothetical protein
MRGAAEKDVDRFDLNVVQFFPASPIYGLLYARMQQREGFRTHQSLKV